jgi:asparagine synthase (glutamine-hydrolysing)
MSGLVGVWNLDDTALEQSVLARMSATLAHRGRDGEGRRVVGSVGFACQHTWVTPEEVGERQPLVAPDGVMLVFDGRLDNRDELRRQLRLGAEASDATYVLAAHARWGGEVARHLNGDFAFALHDPVRAQLLLVRDPIGVRPLYYHAGRGIVAFASEIRALLAHPAIPTRPDEEGLIDYLLPGVRAADRPGPTCFAGIALLPPAHSLLSSSHGGLRVTRYWDFDPRKQIRLRSIGEYAEALRERFATAVRRRIRSAYPVVVSTSGGLDSSSIFCQAEALRASGGAACPAVHAVAYVGPEGTAADERAYLDAIERAYGVAIERIPMVPLLSVAESADVQVSRVEAPLLDVLWGAGRRLQQVAAGLGARRFITGHWGDQVLFSSAYVVDLIRSLRWRMAWRHARAWEQWFTGEETRWLRRRLPLELLRHTLPPPALAVLKRLRRNPAIGRGRWAAPALRRRALRGAHRVSTVGRQFGTAQARALYRETRTAYQVQCMEWNNKVGAHHGLDVAFPFLDRDLVAFLLATPGEVHNWEGVPRGLMRHAMRDVLPEAITQRSWKADFTDPVNATARREIAAIRERVLGAALPVRMGFVDAAALEPALDAVQGRLSRSDAVGSWDVAALLGLEAWLRVFFGESEGGGP